MKSKSSHPQVIERVASLAMRLGGRHLADYGATRSRHDFTQRQFGPSRSTSPGAPTSCARRSAPSGRRRRRVADHVRHRRHYRHSDAVAPRLIEALRRLEYRGYDSAGVATLENGAIERRRAEGKLGNLEALLAKSPIVGTTGIGHTRWATHGAPNETNAHPIATAKVAVVHNGIIENFAELRDELIAKGVVFTTDTDTEFGRAVADASISTTVCRPQDAMAKAMPRLKGAFALACVFAGHPELMVGARRGAPLAVGYGEGEMYLASDALAMAALTDRVAYPEDGDWVELSATRRGDPRRAWPPGRPPHHHASQLSGTLIGKGNFPPLHAEGNLRPAFGAGRLAARAGQPDHAGSAAAATCRSTSPASTAAHHHRLRHRLLCRAGRRNTGSRRSRACRWKPTWPRNSAIASRRCPRAARRCSSRSRARPPTRWRRCKYARAQKQSISVDRQRADELDRARLRRGDRRLWPGPRSASPRPRPSPRSSPCSPAWRWRPPARAARSTPRPSASWSRRSWRCQHAPPRCSTTISASRSSRAVDGRGARRALSRPRHRLSDRAGRRAQAEGDQLHPCRGLCRRRDEARADRADRRGRADHRHRALRRAVREDREQHAGGAGARRPRDLPLRQEGHRRARRQGQLHHRAARGATRSSRRSSTRFRCSCSPITSPWPRAPMSTSRATSPRA